MTDPRTQYQQTWRDQLAPLMQPKREPLWIKVLAVASMLGLLVLCGFIATTL